MSANSVYKPDRTFIVAMSGTNYLVRGNEPLNADGSFAYAALCAKLGSLGVHLKSCTLIDISIISNQGPELTDLNYEFSAVGLPNAATGMPWPPFFNGQDVSHLYGNKIAGQKGSLMWWPVQGCDDDANCSLVENPQYNFSAMVDHLANLMATLQDTVIYYHCEHGHDRTSALSAAYLMAYKGRTLEQVLTQRSPIGAKDFSHAWEPTYKALVEWYASTLPA